MSIDFRNYILNEKMGVISRIFQETEVNRISEIINDFTENIYKNPIKKFSTTYGLLDTVITVNYKPNKNTLKNGDTNGYNINIYLIANKTNYLKLRYTIIHELVHIIQKWYSSDINNLSFIEQIKYYLRRPYLDIIQLTKEEKENSKYLLYLLYREDLYEISTWAHDAYINAFKYKVKYPNKSNQDIVNLVLNSISMNTQFLNNTIKEIKSNDYIFNIIVLILISHFSELDGNNGQRFFDKSIFELNVVKQMKKDMREILNSTYEPDEIADKIVELSNEYIFKLRSYKIIIENSFINHLIYWFNKAKKQYGKAIQLGINDATNIQFKNQITQLKNNRYI